MKTKSELLNDPDGVIHRALHLTRKQGILYQNAQTFLPPWLFLSYYFPTLTGSDQTRPDGPSLNY